jgi:hypothetical protein
VDDLVEWLRAQLDEDERIARAAKSGPWHEDGGVVYATHPTDEVVDYSESAEHIAEHDPARVLREIDAKRRLLSWLGSKNQWALDSGLWGWDDEGALRLLALPYADRPGFREEWRP